MDPRHAKAKRPRSSTPSKGSAVGKVQVVYCLARACVYFLTIDYLVNLTPVILNEHFLYFGETVARKTKKKNKKLKSGDSSVSENNAPLEKTRTQQKE